MNQIPSEMSAIMDQYGSVTGQRAFDFPAELIDWYHGVAQPGTTFCVEYLRVPTEIAPMISIAVLVFCPLYFLGMVVFGPSCLGYTGPARYDLAITPSFDASARRCQLLAHCKHDCQMLASTCLEVYPLTGLSCADGRCPAVYHHLCTV